MPVSIVNNVLGNFMTTLGHQWKWFIAIGGLLVILGIIALCNQATATIFSIYYLGVLILISGVLEIVHAFKVRCPNLSLYWGLAGVLYAVAGCVALFNPLLAITASTLLMAIAFILIGVIRLWNGAKIRREVLSNGMMFSGLLTLLLGILILIGWPVNSLWVLGIFLGIDLLFQGLGYISFGWAIRDKLKQID